MKRRISGWSLSHDTRGSVLLMAALWFTVLFALAGAGYDVGRQQLVRLKLQQASDAAALAGALLPNAENDTARRDEATRVYSLNFPATYMGMNRSAPVVDVTANSITVAAQLPVRTSFVRTLGVEQLMARGRSVTEVGSQSQQTKHDIIMLMDNSGSMNDPDAGGVGTSIRRVDALREAALVLTRALLGDTKIANRMAFVTWNSQILRVEDFTGDVTIGETFLNAMDSVNGGTDSTVGLQQADLMKAGFRGGRVVRSVILLTDGENTGEDDVIHPELNASSLVLCTKLKDEGITLYTIAFGPEVRNNAVVRDFLSSCASRVGTENNEGKYFFIAPDATTLNTVFGQITQSINKVRITQ